MRFHGGRRRVGTRWPMDEAASGNASTLLTDSGLQVGFMIMATTFDELREAVAALPRADKARLLLSVATDLGDTSPRIAFDPNICGGNARILRTRVPVWTLEAARRHGLSEAGILNSFPTLRAEDLVNAWAYVRSHREEIEREIEENESD